MLEYTKSEKKEWKKTTARRSEISKTEIEIIMKNNESKVIYHIRELVPGCGIDNELIIDWSSTIVEYLIKLLYVAYTEMHK